MIKLIKNTTKLDENLKEDKVIKSKKIRESLNKYSRNIRLVENKQNKQHLTESDSFEIDEIEGRPIHKSVKSSALPSLHYIEEVVTSYDLDSLESEDLSIIEDTINGMILDCMYNIKNCPKAYTKEWNDLYEKLEKLVYRVVERLGYGDTLGCGFSSINYCNEAKQPNKKQSNPRVDKIDKLIDDIYDERKDSISKEGEYGVGNQTFKEFRNRGYLDRLKKLKQKELNKELSLEELDNHKGE